ncbi:MAG: hypothetical protein Q4C91_22525 [Eubacteriales bacterium]|nr:hypothetical protein [Eubacteriales bacterium]
MKEKLVLGIWSLTCSLFIFVEVYMCTIIKPEMRTAADGHILSLWEYEFWVSNDLYIIIGLITVGLIIGMINLVQYYMRKER